MALIKLANLEEVTYSIGTGNLVLSGPGIGGKGLYTRCVDGDTFRYYIHGVDSSGKPEGEWESGLGTWRNGNIVERTSVEDSSNNGNLVNFSAGPKYLKVQTNVVDGIKESKISSVSGDSAAKNAVPIVCVGGDHPYSQWWGTTGSDGMAQAYLDRGLRPYIALNTWDDGPGSNSSLFMAWEQVRALSSRGVEMIAHGHRHIMRHMRANTGIRIRSTNAGTNAANVTTTSVVLTDTPNGTTTLLLATYPTIGQLVAAINAVPGWVATNEAGDVFDSDPSTRLLPLRAARTVTATSGTQRFAMSGGVTVSYSGTAYQDVRVRITQGAFRNFEVYCDGVRLVNYNMGNAAYDTLTELISQVRAAGVVGLTIWMCDNGREQTGVDFPSYLQGDEDAFYFAGFESPVSVMGGETRFDMLDGTRGIPGMEVLKRNYDLNKSTAAANGVDLKNYAVSGYHFFSRMTRGNQQFASWRGTVDALVTNPMWQWADTFAPGFRLYWTANSVSYVNPQRSIAVLDAIADSAPTITDLLIHKVKPDGTSAYTFQDGGDVYHDQTETAFIQIADKLKQLQDVGKIRVLTPEEARVAMPALTLPRNRVFNPKFRNSGESIKTADSGFIVPGWHIQFGGASFSAAAIAGDAVTCTTTSAVATTVLQQAAWLKPGRTYEAGFYVDVSAGATGSGVRVTAQAVRGVFRDLEPAGQMIGGQYRLMPGLVTFRFTVPRVPAPYPGRMFTLAGPWNLSTAKNVRLNMNFLGSVTVDLSAGAASAAAVTPKELAAAINAAIAATPAYTAEYHNCARVVRNRVVIENPYSGAYGNIVIEMQAGASADASATVFGATYGLGVTEWAQANAEAWPWWIGLQSLVTGTVSIRDPYIQEIELA